MPPITLERIWSWLQPIQASLVASAAAALVIVLCSLLWLRFRHGRFATIGRAVATPIVLGWEAQGVYRLVRQTGVDGPAALVFAAVTSAVLITLAGFADDHHKEHGTLGIPGTLVWVVAVPMGLIVALSAHSAAEVALRIVLPLLAALVWWVKYAPARPKSTSSDNVAQGSWRLTPRRIAVRLGLIDPTDADLHQVHRERQTRLLAEHAMRAHFGLLGKRWSARRLQKHAQLADAATIAEAVARVTRATMVLELTNPATSPQRLRDLQRQIAARHDALITDPAGSQPHNPGPDVAASMADRHTTAGAIEFDTRTGVAGARPPRHHRSSSRAHVNATGAVAAAGRQDRSPDTDTVPTLRPDLGLQPRSVGTLPASDDSQTSSPGDPEHPIAVRRLHGRDAAAAAEQEWRASIDAGAPLTGAALGKRFGYSDSWGRTVIANAKRYEHRDPAPNGPSDPAPPQPPTTEPTPPTPTTPPDAGDPRSPTSPVGSAHSTTAAR